MTSNFYDMPAYPGSSLERQSIITTYFKPPQSCKRRIVMNDCNIDEEKKIKSSPKAINHQSPSAMTNLLKTDANRQSTGGSKVNCSSTETEATRSSSQVNTFLDGPRRPLPPTSNTAADKQCDADINTEKNASQSELFQGSLSPSNASNSSAKQTGSDSVQNKNDKLSTRSGRLNIDFYSNRIESSPNGAKIDVILKEWKGDYRKLERHHGYIQWLFPLPSAGVNSLAQPLMQDEIQFLSTDVNARRRMVSAFRLMLDFYGMELLSNDATKTVQRAKNWNERYAHLNCSFHNYLRITRILKCLGEVGLADLQLSFVTILVEEAFVRKKLCSCQYSCREFWVPTVQDAHLRQQLEKKMKSGRMS